MSARVAFVQDGARLHYAVPRALYHSGALERVFVDTLVRQGSWSAGLLSALSRSGSARMRRLNERRMPEVPEALIETNWALRAKIEVGRALVYKTPGQFFPWESRFVGRWIRRVGLGRANLLHGFIRNLDPQLVAWAKGNGVAVSGDQMLAPVETVLAQLREQQRRWPGWAKDIGGELEEEIFGEIEEQTWALLEHIVCPSEYVAAEMRKRGFHNLSVHPYPFDCTGIAVREPSKGRLTVGFLGAVNLRKGAPYFCEIAKRLSKRMDFVMVGTVLVADERLSELRRDVRFTGAVSRSQAMAWLKKFDVLLFPSTCEGCAGVVQEALAHGIPVLTSPNAGSTVRHEKEGYLFSYDAIEDFTGALEALDEDRALLARMGVSARVRAEQFQLSQYGEALCATLDKVADRRV